MKTTKGNVTSVPGFLASGIHAGIKKDRSPDLALIYSERECTLAAVMTRNSFKAAPLLVTLQHLKKPKGQAVIINSGNANACTGVGGYRDALDMARATAKALGIAHQRVCVASTGVIGQPLPMDRIKQAIPLAVKALDPRGGTKAAQAIMTTDTYPKMLCLRTRMLGRMIHMGAIAKGSGMIHPRMGTMLAFLSTDANISSPLLRLALHRATRDSFNLVTVDGDTSTNDMVLCLANGAARNRPIRPSSEAFYQFTRCLKMLCRDLAKMIVRDGEGATKLIEIRVGQAQTIQEAKEVAFAVAQSSLVKTAFFGEDPNWGRIMAAIGASSVGSRIRQDRVDLYYGQTKVARNGLGMGKSAEAKAKRYLKRTEVVLRIDLKRGRKAAQIWTADLSPEYVRINSAYRT
jgi:glutamate N-acetyltransferase / amino-acid N-acetyltransferase